MGPLIQCKILLQRIFALFTKGFLDEFSILHWNMLHSLNCAYYRESQRLSHRGYDEHTIRGAFPLLIAPREGIWLLWKRCSIFSGRGLSQCPRACEILLAEHSGFESAEWVIVLVCTVPPRHTAPYTKHDTQRGHYSEVTIPMEARTARGQIPSQFGNPNEWSACPITTARERSWPAGEEPTVRRQH